MAASDPPTGGADTTRVELALDLGTVLVLPAMMVYLGLSAGGYFAGSTGWAAAALALALAVRVGLSGGPLARGGWATALAATCMALFSLWVLASALWSEDLGRAVVEFDRTLLYGLVLLLFASLQRPGWAMRWLPAGFALAAVLLCAVGLATRTLPDLWSWAPSSESEWLSYPVTYSNGLGILASLGMIAGLHLAAWDRGPWSVRVLAVAALPLLATTLAMTHSTGAIVAGVVGGVVYAALARPRGLLVALLAAAPFVFLAADAGQGAELLQRADPTTPAALDQGREVAGAVGLATIGAAALFGLLAALEPRLRRAALPRPRALVVVPIAALVLVPAAFVALDLPDRVGALGDGLEDVGYSRAEQLADDRAVGGAAGVRNGQGRIDYWRVALDAFEEEPVKGTGVGTFAERWARDRPVWGSTTEAHSLYLEILAELGVVGLALLAICLATLLAAFAASLRGDRRPLAAAALGLAAAWLIHAGVDWDWELPVVTVWLFALGGCALAAWPDAPVRRRRASPLLRTAGAGACLAIAITPVTVALSQSRLDGSVSALLRGDCAEAERLASTASTLVPPRAEPFELLAYCASRAGDPRRAIAMMERALDRDPRSWHLYYGLAIVRGSAGRDPRPALRHAQALNPREPIVIDASKRLVGADRGRWRREARASALPLP